MFRVGEILAKGKLFGSSGMTDDETTPADPDVVFFDPMPTRLSAESSPDALEVMRLLYDGCNDMHCVAMGRAVPKGRSGARPSGDMVVKIRDLQSWLPAVFEHCYMQTEGLRTRYIQPNPVYAAAASKRGKRDIREYLDRFLADDPITIDVKATDIAELNCIWGDLDCYKRGITAEDAFAETMKMCRRREMVYPSLVALSGRGLYVVWLLREPALNRAPVNSAMNRHTWKLLTTEFNYRLQHLESDKKSLNKAQWYKQPRTIDWRTGNEVVYAPLFVEGMIPTYDLYDLCRGFQIHSALVDRPAEIPTRLKSKPRTNGDALTSPPKRKRGPKSTGSLKGKARWERMIEEMEILVQKRGGIAAGPPYGRQAFLLHYFQACCRYYGNIMDGPDAKEKAEQQTIQMNRSGMERPMPMYDLRAMVLKQKSKRGYPRNHTVAADLGVTESEARNYGFRVLVPLAMRADRKAVEGALKLEREQTRAAIQHEVLTTNDSSVVIGKRLGVERRKVDYWVKKLHDQRPPKDDPRQTSLITDD